METSNHALRVLVTGGTRGIGRELALKLISSGREVVITGRDTKAADAIKEELDVEKKGLFSFVPLHMDSVSALKKDLPAVLKKIDEKPFDIVVMNAGVMFPEVRTAPIEPTFQVNYLSHFLLAQELLKHKSEDHKMHFVGVSSVLMKHCRWPMWTPPKTLEDFESAFGPRFDSPAGWKEYAFSKMALAALCVDLNSHPNVTATSVNPGNSSTEISARMPGWQRSILRILAKSSLEPTSITAQRVLFAVDTRLSSSKNWLDKSTEEPLPAYVTDEKVREELTEFTKQLIAKSENFDENDA